MSEALAIGWERALIAAEKVKERLRRATRALDDAGVPYAVVGGNAVAEWVARIDDGATRTTRDVDLLIRRENAAAARSVLEAIGFAYHPEVHAFLDGPLGKLKAGLHLLYAGEPFRPEDQFPNPLVTESERVSEFQVVSVLALVRMKLISWHCKDRMHLRDLIDVGVIDVTWVARLPPSLGERLQQLLDNPSG